MASALDGHAMVRRLELKKSTSTGKNKKWWWQRSRELVNSKNKRVCLK
jgi:hypothetical protein